MYRFYYNHEMPGDVLFVVFDPEKKITSSRKNGDIVTLFSNDERVGINIFNISSYVSIPHDGAFLQQDNEILNAVNSLLSSSSLPMVPPNTNSGFFVATVTALEEHPLDEKASIVSLSMGEKNVSTVTRYSNLKVGDKVVVETDGCLDYEGSIFHSHQEKNIPFDVRIANAQELQFVTGENDKAYLTDKPSGTDFFA